MFGTSLLIEPPVRREMTCVCCNCRRERTASDDWQEHTPRAGERLTHGICPPCIHELYPDIAHLVCGQ